MPLPRNIPHLSHDPPSLNNLHISLSTPTPSQNNYPAKQHARLTARKLSVSAGLIYLPGQASIYLDDSDQFRPFRQRRYFYYLSGVDEPDCVVTYDVDRDVLTLYVPYVDARTAVWFGPGIGLEEAGERYDVDEVRYGRELEGDLERWVEGNARKGAGAGGKVYLLHDWQKPDLSPLPSSVSSSLFNATALQPAMDAARVIKDEHEIGLIRRANEITGLAHRAVLQNLSTFTNERDIEATFLQTCVSRGVKTQSYKTIAGSGENAAILHYMKNDEPLAGRQLVCLDAGCDWDCYASDVTRTFPISGYFTEKAERIYGIVQQMQSACIERIGPGRRYRDLDDLARVIMVKGLGEIGILKGGSIREVIQAGADRIFFPHGLGHHVGLEVHDVSEKPIMGMSKGRNVAHEAGFLPPCTRDRPELEEGMVVTVEPGIYFSRAAFTMVTKEMASFIDLDLARSYLPVGGVRIEDDILVTKEGYEVLTTAPKGEEALEIIRKGPCKC